MGSRAFTLPYLSKFHPPRKALSARFFTFPGAGKLGLTPAASTKNRRLAGAEGLEPPTYGFGDRRSTN